MPAFVWMNSMSGCPSYRAPNAARNASNFCRKTASVGTGCGVVDPSSNAYAAAPASKTHSGVACA